MRVLVCGGRDFDDWGCLCSKLDGVMSSNGRLLHIVHGNAIGADFLARVWAKFRNCPQTPFPADWRKYGKAAGFICNQQMLDDGKPDLVVAFPGGVGTADMVRRARKAGVEVIEVK